MVIVRVAIIIISDSAFTIMPLIYLRTRPAGTLRHHYVGVANLIALLLRHVEELFFAIYAYNLEEIGQVRSENCNISSISVDLRNRSQKPRGSCYLSKDSYDASSKN